MDNNDRQLQLSAVIEEWKDLRDEIKRRIDQRTVITEFMITLVSALLTAAIVSHNFYILGIIPFAAEYCLYHVKATYYIHRLLTTYVRDQIENQKMKVIFPDSKVQWLSWETYYKGKVTDKEKERASRRRFYNLFALGLYLGCGMVFSTYAFLNLPLYLSVALAVSFGVFGFLALKLAWMFDPYKQSEEVEEIIARE